MGSHLTRSIDAAWLTILSRIGLLISGAAATTVVLAWIFGWTVWQHVLQGLPTMKFNTALCLLLLAVAGHLASFADRKFFRLAAGFVATLVLLLTGASLIQDLLGLRLGIDTLFVADPDSVAIGKVPGRMSVGTAAAIGLLAVGLILMSVRSPRLSLLPTLVGGSMGLVSIAIFIFVGHPEFTNIFATTAIHTGLLISLTACCYLQLALSSWLTSALEGSAHRDDLRRALPLSSLVLLGAVCSIGLTLVLAFNAESSILSGERQKFLHLSEMLTASASGKVIQPVYGLKGARGVYAASEEVTRGEFEAYVESRDLPVEFPGCLSFGMVKRVRSEDLNEFIAKERADGSPEFSPESLANDDIHYLIKYSVPTDPNCQSLGFDMASKPALRSAIERAVATGEHALSGKITGNPYLNPNADVVIFVPVYANDQPCETPEQRKAALVGLLFAPVDIELALAADIEANANYLDFEIYDGSIPQHSTLLFDCDGHNENVQGLIRDKDFERRLFHESQTVELAGQTWTYLTSTLARFEGETNHATPASILVGGTVLSMLLCGLIWSLGHGRARAVAMAAEMTEELHKSTDRAEAANRSKSEFLANMSHEIRTPLTALLGYCDLLQEEIAASESPKIWTQWLETSRNAGRHLQALINEILDLSKIEAGELQVELIKTDLVELLTDIRELMESRTSEKGVKFQVVLDTPIPDKVISDPTRLKQILMNLTGNALKFTEQGSVQLRVRVVENDAKPFLQISVEDTGLGMKPNQAAALFRPFVQADTSITRKFGGTGLGLTISRKLAVLLGGNVWLERSAPSEGSCFMVQLPLIPSPESTLVTQLEPKKVAKVARASQQLHGKILLAEDGPDNQRLIRVVLAKAGVNIDVADNGQIALNMIHAAEADDSPYDLLLTDMQMPEMDGETLARTLRQEGNPISIVALTAHTMAGDRQKCLDAGCNDFATKPIDRHKLIATCQQWLMHQPTLSN